MYENGQSNCPKRSKKIKLTFENYPDYHSRIKKTEYHQAQAQKYTLTKIFNIQAYTQCHLNY